MKQVFGTKIGMTQVFTEGHKVVPVTAVDVSSWIIVGATSADKEGYDALRVACLKDKYANAEFSQEWITAPQKFFKMVREIKLDAPYEDFQVGKRLDFTALFETGSPVHVSGVTKGKGFAGVVRRWNFSGGPASHGSKLGRRPGAMGGARMQGKVPKGKKLPGHMGVRRRMMRNLEIMHIDSDNQVLMIKGSIPGSAGSFVEVEKV
jgi:large subunit ribosomal protein L3